MYAKKQIDQIQLGAANVYYYAMKKGLTHLQAIQYVLNDGVEYNDLMAGILTKGIEG